MRIPALRAAFLPAGRPGQPKGSPAASTVKFALATTAYEITRPGSLIC